MATPALPKTALFDSLISDQNTPIARKISLLDQICDYIPVVSTITNLCNLVFKTCYEPKNSPSIEYAEYLQGKSTLRCTLLLIPFFGNLAIFIYDLYKGQADNPVSSKANAVADASFFPPGGCPVSNAGLLPSNQENAPASHHRSLNQENRSFSLPGSSKTPHYPMTPPKNYGDLSASVPNPLPSSNSSMYMSSPSLALAAGGQGLLPSNGSVSSMNSGLGLRGLPASASSLPSLHSPPMNIFPNLPPAAGGRGSLPLNNPVPAGNFPANPLANPSIPSANAVQVQERNDVEGQKSKPLISQASQLYAGKVEEPNNETDKKALLALVREIILAKEDQALDLNSLPKCNLNYYMPEVGEWDTYISGTDYLENHRRAINNRPPPQCDIRSFVTWTPLMFAVALGKDKIVDQLLEAGADMSVQTLSSASVPTPNGTIVPLAQTERNSQSILYLALVHGKYELFKKLGKYNPELLEKKGYSLIDKIIEHYDYHKIRPDKILGGQNLFHQQQLYSLIQWILEQAPNCLKKYRERQDLFEHVRQAGKEKPQYLFPHLTNRYSQGNGYQGIFELLENHEKKHFPGQNWITEIFKS